MGWDRIRNHAARFAYNSAASAVARTAPITPADDGVVLLSMIGTAVIRPYLVAVKSLWHQLRRGRVVILDDGTLTRADKEVLARHLGDPRISPIAEIDTGPCPRGGCWERLLAILDLRADDYVIQLDSDTVTIGPVPEVAEAIAANRSFTLAGGIAEADAGALPLSTIAPTFYPHGLGHLRPNRNGHRHIQATIEALMAELPLPTDRAYVRGCAAFAGFARMGTGRREAEVLCTAAEARLGSERWSEWGSEQVTSNYVIANDPAPVVLPYTRYANYWGEPWGSDMRFLHFVGTHRYRHGAYRAATLQAIAQL
ncbi:hypothetical protein [Neoroseomonas soli]|uniref:Uncharacterized protein n=1 Tax=Neoroseomonas soli TaxID=1081025 RepID=A0A9X9WSM9_9PROT|nr:hypothetical protein [Neoroseomonas soli]MBR0670158.1 hypothetical protein [Neoroseomonas soli]